MTANPITFLEIEAYARLHLLQMRPFELRLLSRLDDLMLTKSRAKGKDEPAEEVDVSDVAGVKFLLAGKGVRRPVADMVERKRQMQAEKKKEAD